MNGAQDLGGKMGYGPVVPEPDEPLFHGRWESRAMAITVALGALGMWNIDTSRHARESIAPVDYISLTYYQIWLRGVERLLLANSMVSEEEWRTATALQPPAKTKNPALTADRVEATIMAGGPAERDAVGKPKYTVGDAVHTRNINPTDHTRLPSYAKAKRGVIERVHGCHVFPDSNARGQGENPQWLYSVRFTAHELWGDGYSESDEVFLDVWEPYFA